MRRWGYVPSVLVLILVRSSSQPGGGKGRILAQPKARPTVLVIDGGTLIDGNGGAPIPDVQIVNRKTGLHLDENPKRLIARNIGAYASTN
jgi:hypothetical protein